MKAAVSGGSIVHEKKRSVSLAPMNSSIPAITASTAETPKNQRSPGLVGGVTGDSLGSGASAGPRAPALQCPDDVHRDASHDRRGDHRRALRRRRPEDRRQLPQAGGGRLLRRADLPPRDQG